MATKVDKEWVKAKLKDVGGQRPIADKIGRDRSVVSRILAGETQRPTQEQINIISGMFKVRPAELLRRIGLTKDDVTDENDDKLEANNRVDRSQDHTDHSDIEKNAPPEKLVGEARIAEMAPGNHEYRLPKIKVRGTAEGGPSGAFLLLPEEAVSYVDRTPALNRIPHVFAIYVVGDSMEPAINHQELRFVDPNKPPAPGDFVLIQQKNGEHDDTCAFIKRLVRRTARKVICDQFNPKRTIEFDAQRVVIQRIIPWNEVHGA